MSGWELVRSTWNGRRRTVYHRRQIQAGTWLTAKLDGDAWEWGVYVDHRKVHAGRCASWRQARAAADTRFAELGPDDVDDHAGGDGIAVGEMGGGNRY